MFTSKQLRYLLLATILGMSAYAFIEKSKPVVPNIVLIFLMTWDMVTCRVMALWIF